MAALVRLFPRAMSTHAPKDIKLLKTVQDVRQWRQKAQDAKQTVGFVATMGALHEGHLDLVRKSLEQCDHTVVSIFVNPAQFSPAEDLSSYPRTVEADLQKLSQLPSGPSDRAVSAVFLPSVPVLYPSGIEQDVAKQRGTFLEVKGLSHQMEGGSRPTFFRGVATVVLKLFNIIQPDWTFFGQKDIQQCFVLRQMLKDLHLSHPTPDRMVIVPTHRDPVTGLALSSRNAYLSPAEHPYAPTLRQALKKAEAAYLSYTPKDQPVPAAPLRDLALAHMEDARQRAEADGVKLKADYIAFNAPGSLDPLDDVVPGQGVIVSGAMWCGKTRLIDNLVLDYNLNATA